MKQAAEDGSEMTVAMVTMAFPWPSETFAARDIRALKAQGVDVHVHQLRRRTRNQDSLARQQGVTDVPVSRPGFFGSFDLRKPRGPGIGKVARLALKIAVDGSTWWRERVRCLLLLPLAAQVARRVLREQPDVLHLYWGHYPSMVVLLVGDLLPGTRITMFLGAYDLARGLGVSRWAAPSCKVVFTHAHANLPDLRKVLRPSASVIVAHRGIDLSPYPPVADLARIRKEKTVFSAGRLIPNKGVDQVIRSFGKILEAHPDTTLRIAGDGAARKELEALVEKLELDHAVTFLGWLDENRIREEMLRAKVFMMLSTKRGERLPNAVKEAMAAGCVCVVSPSAGIDELIDDGIDGYIVPPDDGDRVPDRANRHLGIVDFELIQRLAAEKIRREFDVVTSARRYVEVWRTLLSSDDDRAAEDHHVPRPLHGRDRDRMG